jgi:hypothetical protein
VHVQWASDGNGEVGEVARLDVRVARQRRGVPRVEVPRAVLVEHASQGVQVLRGVLAQQHEIGLRCVHAREHGVLVEVQPRIPGRIGQADEEVVHGVELQLAGLHEQRGRVPHEVEREHVTDQSGSGGELASSAAALVAKEAVAGVDQGLDRWKGALQDRQPSRKGAVADQPFQSIGSDVQQQRPHELQGPFSGRQEQIALLTALDESHAHQVLCHGTVQRSRSEGRSQTGVDGARSPRRDGGGRNHQGGGGGQHRRQQRDPGRGPGELLTYESP